MSLTLASTATHSAQELHSWTFSADSIAACSIHDVLDMRKNTVDGYDFFWLGRIPCRSVKIVGIVVGIQVYERKIIYTVDDGTGVVDCFYFHRPVPKAPLEPLNPVAEIGQTVRVTGSVRLQYQTRAVFTDQINQCPSPNEELVHSRLVQELHRMHYSLKEAFVIPKRVETPTYDSPKTLSNPSADFPSSTSSSPVKSSPIRDRESTVVCASPPKLRHPSRLHTHDLTENIFRIYVKHYLDHVANKHEGFTISYLRRVPELSLLADRVVHTVANRREREQRKRPKEIMSTRKSSLTSPVVTIASDKLARKMKRLFQWAVIQLLREGCIILWDGPTRPLPDSKSMITDTGRLWKITRPSLISFADDGFFDSDSRSLNAYPVSGYISDQQIGEESYISLTPAYLSKHVIQAVQSIVKIQADKRKPYAGATAEGILSVLKKDDQWRYIGIWNIQDALELLRGEGAVWDMGKGKWDLTD